MYPKCTTQLFNIDASDVAWMLVGDTSVSVFYFHVLLVWRLWYTRETARGLLRHGNGTAMFVRLQWTFRILRYTSIYLILRSKKKKKTEKTQDYFYVFIFFSFLRLRRSIRPVIGRRDLTPLRLLRVLSVAVNVCSCGRGKKLVVRRTKCSSRDFTSKHFQNK